MNSIQLCVIYCISASVYSQRLHQSLCISVHHFLQYTQKLQACPLYQSLLAVLLYPVGRK